MTRDAGLEELLREDLQGRTGLTEKTMFGGRVWLLNGNLLCGARTDGMLVRLGKGNDGWAFEMPGVASMVMGQRQMHGWVRLAPGAWGKDGLRRRLVSAALAWVGTLPPKST